MGLIGRSSGESLAFLSPSWNFRSSTLPLLCSAFICSLKRSSRREAPPLSAERAPPGSSPDRGRGGASWAMTASSAGSIVSRPLQHGQVTVKVAMARPYQTKAPPARAPAGALSSDRNQPDAEQPGGVLKKDQM